MDADSQNARDIALKASGDGRGMLYSAEELKEIPFPIRRFFVIMGVPQGALRGGHAHKKTEQALFCLQGSLTLTTDDGTRRDAKSVGPLPRGILLSARVWHEMSDFSPDCIALVVASEPYDEADYLRDYQEFLAYIR